MSDTGNILGPAAQRADHIYAEWERSHCVCHTREQCGYHLLEKVGGDSPDERAYNRKVAALLSELPSGLDDDTAGKMAAEYAYVRTQYTAPTGYKFSTY